MIIRCMPYTCTEWAALTRKLTLNDIFKAAHLLNISYVLLRNFETLGTNAMHPDIDILVEKFTQACVILTGRNEVCALNASKSMLRRVRAGGRMAAFDFIFVGDDYCCEQWQRVFVFFP